MAETSQKISVSLVEFYKDTYDKAECCICGGTLVRGGMGRPKVACSDSCKKAATSLALKTARIYDCIVCAKEISPIRDSRVKTCSPECKKEKNWRRNLFRVHHLRFEEFEAILTSQGGLCAICSYDFQGDKSQMNVDHDHYCCPGRIGCGKCVRGICCNGCNGGMGLFKDKPENLIAAAQYLTEYRRKKYG